MDFLILFGSLLLLLALIVLPFLKTEVNNPNCLDEVNSVKYNKIGFISCVVIGLALIIIGICFR